MLRRLTAFLLMMLLVIPGAAGALASDFYVTDISVPEGIIPSGIGEITITMNDAIDPDTLDSISFVSDDGSDIKGGSYIRTGEDEAQAIVTFGRLDVGSYILSIDEGLTSAGGLTAAAQAYSYEVTVSESRNVLAAFDFEDIEPAVYTGAELMELAPSGFTFGGTNAVHEITDSAGGRRYNKMSNPGGTGGGSASVTLSEAITSGTINVDVDYSGDASSYTRNLLTLYALDEDGKVVSGSKKSTNVMRANYANGGWSGTHCGSPKGTIVRDTDNFWSLRYVISRETAGEAWTVKGYDKANNMAEIFTGSIQDSVIPEIQRISFMDCWGSANSNYYGCVDEICVWTPVEQKVIYADTAIRANDEKINIVLFDDEEEENIEAYLTLDGTDIDAEIAYEPDNRAVTVSPKDYLIQGEEYILTFSNGSINEEIFIEVYDYPVVPVEAVYSDGEISYTLSGDEIPENLRIFAVGYDAEGRLMSGGVYGDVAQSHEGTISAEALSSCETIKIMVWEICDGYMRPVCDTAQIAVSE